MKAHYGAGDVVAGVRSCWTLGNDEAQPARLALRGEGAGYSCTCLHQLLGEGFLKPVGCVCVSVCVGG